MTTLATDFPQAATMDDPDADHHRRQKQTHDLLLAAIYWNSLNPAYEGLLTGNRGWTWDQERQTYVSRNGSAIPQDVLRSLALGIIDQTEHRIEDTTSDMLDKKMSVEDWQRRTEDDLEDEFFALMLLACGGIDNVEDADISETWGTVGTPASPGVGLSEAFVRLKNFSDEIRSDEAGSDDFVRQRAGGYSNFGWYIYQRIQQTSYEQLALESGQKIEEISVLDPLSNHCRDEEFTLGCPGISESGWQPAGTLPVPGSPERSCFVGCRCHLAYRFAPTGAE